MADDPCADSLALHARVHGTPAITGTVPAATRRNLGLARTPDVAGVCRAIARNPRRVVGLRIRPNTAAVVPGGSSVPRPGNRGAAAALPVTEDTGPRPKPFAGADAFPLRLDTQDTDEVVRAVRCVAPVSGGITPEDIAPQPALQTWDRLAAAAAARRSGMCRTG